MIGWKNECSKQNNEKEGKKNLILQSWKQLNFELTTNFIPLKRTDHNFAAMNKFDSNDK